MLWLSTQHRLAKTRHRMKRRVSTHVDSGSEANQLVISFFCIISKKKDSSKNGLQEEENGLGRKESIA